MKNFLAVVALAVSAAALSTFALPAAARDAAPEAAGAIAPYTPRPGRERPVIAVVGENSGTVLSDFATFT